MQIEKDQQINNQFLEVRILAIILYTVTSNGPEILDISGQLLELIAINLSISQDKKYIMAVHTPERAPCALEEFCWEPIYTSLSAGRLFVDD